jgi:hypothetical protein
MRNPVSRFAYSYADLDIKRSLIDRNHDHKTTMSAGLLYPILVDEIYPGDTYTVDCSPLIRMSTPIHPVMDNLYADIYFFFCPNRIIWDHWKEFMGESPSDPYLNPIEYSVPMLVGNEPSDSIPASIVPEKSILDYMGIPSNTTIKETSQLPIRAYVKIWNEWFRDQNLQNAADLDTGDSNYSMSSVGFPGTWDNNNKTNPDAYVNNAKLGGDLCPVNKYHDYFTSALKEPQKGNPVPIPLNGFAPVYANNDINVISEDFTKLVHNDGTSANSGAIRSSNGYLVDSYSPTVEDTNDIVSFNNLGADLSQLVGAYATINDLRYAFQLQKFLERDNIGGTRYRELLKAHFGTTSPDASMAVPEFLGGKRLPINISQVLQTSSTDSTSPQGNTAAYSLTSDKFSAFTKSFTEHGWLIGLCAIRTEKTYAQGVECFWNRKNKFDFYFPEFSTISEQPIYNREIYNGLWDTASFELADKIFGYKEPWSELKFKPNRVSAEFRPTYSQSLDVWHYADDYDQQPYLSSQWIRETRANIDRTLAVSSDVSDQFICDFYFKMRTARVIPAYVRPGLADHH